MAGRWQTLSAGIDRDEQPAARLGAQFPQNTVNNWLVADLRGVNVDVDLRAKAKELRDGVRKSGRIAGKDGPTYDKVFFILDDKMVEMP